MRDRTVLHPEVNDSARPRAGRAAGVAVPDGEELGQREWRLAYAVGLRVLRNADRAEDLAQDTLIRAFRSRHTYDGRASFDAWLWRIAFNTAVSHLRASHRRRPLDALRAALPTRGLPSRGPNPEQETAYHEALRALDACLQTMSAEDRAAFMATRLLGVTGRELGMLLGSTPNAAKQRTFRARRFVREQLAGLSVSRSPPTRERNRDE